MQAKLELYEQRRSRNKNEKLKTSMIYCTLWTGYGTRKSHTNKPWKYGTFWHMCKLKNYLTIPYSFPYKGQTYKQIKFFTSVNILFGWVHFCVFLCIYPHGIWYSSTFFKHNDIYVEKRWVCGVSCHGHTAWHIMKTQQKVQLFLRSHITDFVSHTSDDKNYAHKLSTAVIYYKCYHSHCRFCINGNYARKWITKLYN